MAAEAALLPEKRANSLPKTTKRRLSMEVLLEELVMGTPNSPASSPKVVRTLSTGWTPVQIRNYRRQHMVQLERAADNVSFTEQEQQLMHYLIVRSIDGRSSLDIKSDQHCPRRLIGRTQSDSSMIVPSGALTLPRTRRRHHHHHHLNHHRRHRHRNNNDNCNYDQFEEPCLMLSEEPHQRGCSWHANRPSSVPCNSTQPPVQKSPRLSGSSTPRRMRFGHAKGSSVGSGLLVQAIIGAGKAAASPATSSSTILAPLQSQPEATPLSPSTRCRRHHNNNHPPKHGEQDSVATEAIVAPAAPAGATAEGRSRLDSSQSGCLIFVEETDDVGTQPVPEILVLAPSPSPSPTFSSGNIAGSTTSSASTDSMDLSHSGVSGISLDAPQQQQQQQGRGTTRRHQRRHNRKLRRGGVVPLSDATNNQPHSTNSLTSVSSQSDSPSALSSPSSMSLPVHNHDDDITPAMARSSSGPSHFSPAHDALQERHHHHQQHRQSSQADDTSIHHPSDPQQLAPSNNSSRRNSNISGRKTKPSTPGALYQILSVSSTPCLPTSVSPKPFERSGTFSGMPTQVHADDEYHTDQSGRRAHQQQRHRLASGSGEFSDPESEESRLDNDRVWHRARARLRHFLRRDRDDNRHSHSSGSRTSIGSRNDSSRNGSMFTINPAPHRPVEVC